MSSLKLQAGKTFGDEGSARDTRRCLMVPFAAPPDDVGGNGAVNENVDDDGTVMLEILGSCCVDTDMVGFKQQWDGRRNRIGYELIPPQTRGKREVAVLHDVDTRFSSSA